MKISKRVKKARARIHTSDILAETANALPIEPSQKNQEDYFSKLTFKKTVNLLKFS